MRIAVVANTAWYLVNFRLNLMRALLAAGHQVIAVAPADSQQSERLQAVGVKFVPVPISGSGTNPLRELLTVWRLLRVFRLHGVDAVLSYTPKGNLYSAMAALVCGGLPFVPNVSGLGRAFIRRSWVTVVVKLLYRGTLGQAYRVFFQNMDDMALFIQLGLVSEQRCERLPGSGVDLARFVCQSMPPSQVDAPVFLLVARLLWDKGIAEYVAAARRLLMQYPKAKFQILGFLDVDNPSAVPRSDVEAWQADGCIDYLGATDDVRPFMASADCVVLPSYREGVPRTLLEAAATGRPVITTSAPGCRDAVVDGITGLMCQPASADDLLLAMQKYMALSTAERTQMGLRGRARIEQEFDEKTVLAAYMQVIEELKSNKVQSQAC